jgi:hypothetical protein
VTFIWQFQLSLEQFDMPLEKAAEGLALCRKIQ